MSRPVTQSSERKRQFWRPIRRLHGDERGVTMIEFALLAPIFFAMMGAILETAVISLSAQILDSATHDAARTIRTGQAQNDLFDVDDFKDKVCEHLFGMFNCDELHVRVRKITNFNGATTTPPIDPVTGDWILTEDFQMGGRKDIIIAETYYKWPIILTGFGLNFATTPDGKRLLASVRVWRNEPF